MNQSRESNQSRLTIGFSLILIGLNQPITKRSIPKPYLSTWLISTTVLLKVSQLQREQMKVGALTKETELLKHSVKQLKGQVHQLQELLANREQEHR